jgi:hypothetical protein
VGDYLSDITTSSAPHSSNSASLHDSPDATSGIDGASRICLVGETELQDRFTPSQASVLPSPAQMRALRSEVGGSANLNHGTPLSTLRFHPPVWDALGTRVSAPVCEPEQARTAPRLEPVMSTPAPAEAATPVRAGFSPDLWYAQAASHELHQKKEQLSFRPIRTAPQPDLDLSEALAGGIQEQS